MKKLIIIGAGGFGREVLMWAKQSSSYNKEWTIKGFLDDNIKKLDEVGIDIPVLGGLEDYTPTDDDLFIIAIGQPKIKKRILDFCNANNFKLTNVIHKTAIISESAIMGTGIIVCPFSIISSKSVIHDNVIINTSITIGHDSTIGKNTVISGHCDITGNCTVGENVFFGSKSCTRPGVIIEDNATIGLGSAVTKNVKEGKTVFGVPAKNIF